MLADIMKWPPNPGIGPYEGYDADETLGGGERLDLAGFEIDVIFTPGHSIGHLTYSIPDESAIFSGDVLFQGSVGRVDLPGGDWPTLAASIRDLIDAHPAETMVFPGHMGLTTLEREIASNPFLADLPAAAE
jgi:glyoxylase-like metal-dependent hydrolase (beta-lactamase superfamily II)